MNIDTGEGTETVIVWDIETDTSGGFGLDPDNGPISSIAAAAVTIDGSTRTARIVDDHFCDHDDEAELIGAFLAWLRGWSRRGAERLVGWNSGAFDAPFLVRRAELAGVEAADVTLALDTVRVPKYDPLPGFEGRYAHTICGLVGVDVGYDGWDRERVEGLGVRWSLKPVAEAFGLEPISVDRTRMHDLSQAELAAYNRSDVRVTAELYLADLLGTDGLPYLGRPSPDLA